MFTTGTLPPNINHCMAQCERCLPAYTGETGVAGVTHLAPKDFGPVIERAKQLPGFGPQQEVDGPKHLVGFGRETMLGAAPAVSLHCKLHTYPRFICRCCDWYRTSQVLDAIKAGNLKHIFLVGGCDGSEGSRRLGIHYASQRMLWVMYF